MIQPSTTGGYRCCICQQWVPPGVQHLCGGSSNPVPNTPNMPSWMPIWPWYGQPDIKVPTWWDYPQCPICKGKAFVPKGFYPVATGAFKGIDGKEYEWCKACGGKGIVVIGGSGDD